MSAFPGSESEIALSAERLREALRGRYGLPGRHVAGDGYVEFEGMQLAIERRVTFRVVRGPQSGSLLSSERVRALGQLSHPNIQPVLELIELDDLLVVVTPSAIDKGPWWTSRSLDGVSPDDSERWIEIVLKVIRETATALAYAHGRGLVHGVLRPECIQFSEGGSVCMGGFLTGELSGAWSPYVSPEQQGGAVATAASDQYALGVLAYLLLTGAPPFTDVEGQRVGASPNPLAGLARVPGDAIMRMIAYSADDRFPSMSEVILALDDVSQLRSDAADSVGVIDENVQFTVYRPSAVRPAQWYPMLAFAHLAEARQGSSEPDPVAMVEHQAKQVLEDAVGDYKQIVEDAAQPIPREGIITFVPEMAGVEFNPPRCSFEWEESVHRADFRLRAEPSLHGKIARGHLTVYHGAILLAELTLSIKVDRAHQPQLAVKDEAPVRARPYRKIFASYSHKDVDIVHQFERYAATLGDSYLRDARDIRAGEVWTERLEELMREADIMQLFWSSNSMTSPFVRKEWEYALSLGRPNFVRPTYWEDPMPSTPDGSLPTPELLRLQFQRIAASRAEFKEKFGHSGTTEEVATPAPSVARSMPAPRVPVSATSSVTLGAEQHPPRRSRLASRVNTTVAALGFVGIVVLGTKGWMGMSATSLEPVGSAPPVAVDSSADTASIVAPPPVFGRIDTIRYSPPPPPPPPPPAPTARPPLVESPVTARLREVEVAYQRDSASALARFDQQRVVIDFADSAKVVFARRADQDLLRTDSTQSRQLVCRIDGTRSGRLVVRDCTRARSRPD